MKSSVFTCSPVLQPGCAASFFQFVCPYSPVFTCSPEQVASSQCNGQRHRRRIMAGESWQANIQSSVFTCSPVLQPGCAASLFQDKVGDKGRENLNRKLCGGRGFAPIRLLSRVRLSQWLHRNATGNGIADESKICSRCKGCELLHIRFLCGQINSALITGIQDRQGCRRSNPA
jgi:hypothetical protein